MVGRRRNHSESIVKGVVSEESILISEGMAERGIVRKLWLVMVILNYRVEEKIKAETERKQEAET